MNRDQKIAHLVLHGYVPYADQWGWVSIWNEQLSEGRMCKYFQDGANGPGWDVRALISSLGLTHKHEVPWHRIDDDQLAQLTAEELPPKFKHDLKHLSAVGVTLGQDL